MTTIGDVLMVFGGVLAAAGSAWAAMVLAALLFPTRMAAAANELEGHASRAALGGVLVTFLSVAVSLVLIGSPVPLLKVGGLLLLGAYLAVALVGCSGLVRLTAQRVKGTGGPEAAFAGYLRGGALVVGACAFPLIGWIVTAPVVLILGSGAGFRAFLRVKAPEPFGAEA